MRQSQRAERRSESLGRYVKDYTVDRIISAMVGKELKNQSPKTKVPIGETLLEVKGLTKKSTFEDISFELHKGEILGLPAWKDAVRTKS